MQVFFFLKIKIFVLPKFNGQNLNITLSHNKYLVKILKNISDIVCASKLVVWFISLVKYHVFHFFVLEAICFYFNDYFVCYLTILHIFCS